MWKSKRIILLLFLISNLELISMSETSAFSDVDFMKMSLQELMDVKINSGNLTSMEMSKTPVSITIIDRDEIILTPARTLLDLLEIYVPGFTFSEHLFGPRLGLRGNMSDQNYSYQILLNGQDINLKSIYGAFFEIQNRNLSDIERIEIIRGPGSVTYGQGAIAGIINIIPKEYDDTEPFEASFGYDAMYRISNYSISTKYEGDNFKISFNGGISSSKGLENTQLFYIDRSHGYGFGYMGNDWGDKGLGSPVKKLYGDIDNNPEVKMYLVVEAPMDIKFSARYSNYGHYWLNQALQSQEGAAFPSMKGKLFASSLSKRSQLSDRANLKSSFEFSSANFRQTHLWQGSNLPIEHAAQLSNSFSENEFKLKTLLNYEFSDFVKAAGGAELSYFYWGPEWGMGDNTFLMSCQAPIRFAILDTSSKFYQFYGDDFATLADLPEAFNYSIFGEANIDLSKSIKLLLSARYDKNKFADGAFSPRLALIYEMNEQNTLKLIAQQSTRLPFAIDMYSEYYMDNSAEPEKLNGLELIYNCLLNKNFLVNTSLYYQSIKQVYWINENLYSGIVGRFDLIGLEADFKWLYGDNLALGGSYSFIKQLEWDPVYRDEGYLSDMGADSIEVVLNELGENRINNFPSHSIKLYTNIKLFDKFWLHLNGRLGFAYGQMDMPDMFKEAHDNFGSSQTKNEMSDIYDELVDNGYGQTSFTSSMSINWETFLQSQKVKFSLYFMNLLSYNHIRYAYQFWEYGNLRQYPRQVSFLEEGFNCGLNVRLSLK